MARRRGCRRDSNRRALAEGVTAPSSTTTQSVERRPTEANGRKGRGRRSVKSKTPGFDSHRQRWEQTFAYPRRTAKAERERRCTRTTALPSILIDTNASPGVRRPTSGGAPTPKWGVSDAKTGKTVTKCPSTVPHPALNGATVQTFQAEKLGRRSSRPRFPLPNPAPQGYGFC